MHNQLKLSRHYNDKSILLSELEYEIIEVTHDQPELVDSILHALPEYFCYMSRQ